MRVSALLTALAGALALVAAPAAAQSSQCENLSETSRRTCNAALDGTPAFHPLAGLRLGF